MGMKVLLIDDSGLMRKLILRSLRQADIGVTETFEAANGQEGLDALKANKPDVVLCDWNMPVMDGIQFVEKACTFSSVPIVMLTTEGTVEKIATARKAGATGYVTKPFTPDKLGTAISAAIEEKRAA